MPTRWSLRRRPAGPAPDAAHASPQDTGAARPDSRADGHAAGDDPVAAEAARGPAAKGRSPATAACPWCGVLLQPVPVASRRCPRCREPIVVRRDAGRVVLLTEAAVPTFESERRRAARGRGAAIVAGFTGVSAPCPSCGAPLDPVPSRDRLCPRCRRPLVVRHVEGRTVLLTREAVPVFEAQRQRSVNEDAWRRERDDWLHLARDHGLPRDRREKLASEPISAESVRRARDLALSASHRAARAAAREKRWGQVGQLHREEAGALYRAAGSPAPAPDEIAAVHRAGMIAVLRSLGPAVHEAEIVGQGCCRACRADDGRAFEIAAELRTGRLPHAGCPRGLCPCDWWPAPDRPTRPRRRRPARPTPGGTTG